MPVPGAQHRRDAMLRSWPTLAAYQAADPRRRASREVLFGSDWLTRQDLPPWRAAGGSRRRGEFIVVRLDAVREADCGPVQLLGTFADLGALEIGLRVASCSGLGRLAALAGSAHRRPEP
jgi:hypothetical protein